MKQLKVNMFEAMKINDAIAGLIAYEHLTNINEYILYVLKSIMNKNQENYS